MLVINKLCCDNKYIGKINKYTIAFDIIITYNSFSWFKKCCEVMMDNAL